MKPIFFLIVVATAGICQDDIMPRPPRRADAGNELAALVRETRVGEPQYHRHMAVYPLFIERGARERYWTMEEALDRGVLLITEKGEGSVPELVAENRSDDPVFLLAGEIVRGGKQNRVISQDVMLPPRSGPIRLGVFCVERGRWTAESNRFGGEKELAHSNLRQQLSTPSVAQGGVWGEVSRKADAVAPSAAAGTGYVGKVYEDREVRRDVEEYSKAIRMPREANGMAVMIGGRVVGVELFGDAGLFAALREKLLRSYAMDAIEWKSEERIRPPVNSVEQFLRRVESARLVAKETVGVGRYFGVQGGRLYGSVLIWREQEGAHGVVHASLFDEQPVVEPQPRPMPYERLPMRD